MNKIIYFPLILIGVLISQLLYSQSNPILSMSVEQVSVANNFSLDSLPVLTDSTVFEVGVKVNLFDTLDIQSIDVEIGTADGTPDLFNHSYAFDVSNSLGSGLSYARNAYSILLGAGQVSNMISYYSRVRLHYTDGTYSPYVVFNR